MDKSKAVRGAVGSGAVAALIAAIAQFNSFESFLIWALTAAGGGVIVWGLIELWDAASKQAGRPLNPDLKMYVAQALAIGIPVAGTYVAYRLKLIELDYAHVVGMIAVVYQISQTIHWEASSEPHVEAHPPEGDSGGGFVQGDTSPTHTAKGAHKPHVVKSVYIIGTAPTMPVRVRTD